ncbi:hypothetical protein WN51_12622 [Melipona quadrifasciata]|uniref:Uncharacterized protein n=1 Tax=Melipona quadrifasciata TaxID=166423 RepID=A0A0N0BH73_9HYME|nr:hypothetical protein WN51_12622 [Melipona quadrifasciata]
MINVGRSAVGQSNYQTPQHSIGLPTHVPIDRSLVPLITSLVDREPFASCKDMVKPSKWRAFSILSSRIEGLFQGNVVESSILDLFPILKTGRKSICATADSTMHVKALETFNQLALFKFGRKLALLNSKDFSCNYGVDPKILDFKFILQSLIPVLSPLVDLIFHPPYIQSRTRHPIIVPSLSKYISLNKTVHSDARLAPASLYVAESTKRKPILEAHHFEDFIMSLQETKGSRLTRLVIEGTSDLSIGTCVGKLMECWGV